MFRQHRFRRAGRKLHLKDSADNDGVEFDRLNASGKRLGDAKSEGKQIPPWKALFFFTVKPHTTCLIIAVVSAILSGLASPASALLVGKAFQGFSAASDGDALVRTETKYVMYMLAVGFGSWFLHYIFFASWITFGELQAKSARDRLFNGMLIKDVKWFDLRKSGVSALIPRLQVQIRELQLATAQPFGSLITAIATACFNIGLALIYSWKLTLVIIATVPVVALVLGFLGAAMQPHVKKQQEKLTEASKHVSGALNAIETIKCFNGQDSELRKYSTTMQESSGWYMRVVHSNALQFAIISFMASAMFVQGFYYGGVLVRKGEKSTGDVITTFLASLGAFQAIAGVLPQMIVLEKGRTAGATLRAVMAQIEQGPFASSSKGFAALNNCQGDIELKNVSFAYPSRPDHKALRNLHLLIPGGSTTFVIGRSGSGKSTLGQLLMRFYAPEEGEISFDGFSLSDFDVAWLRSQITLVEQTSTLFEDTIFNNIALGRDSHYSVTREEIAQAAEFALLQSMIIDMPEGYHTVVGAKGSTVSGGQRQRMALARAYIRDTPVLILDESTSALDQISRSLMMDAIRNWRQDRTTIIITHDISQVLPENYTVILEEGHVIQEGYRRHMERIKDCPFQSFLSEAEQANVPSATAKFRSAHTGLSHQTAGTYVPTTRDMTYIDDPLEAHLAAGEDMEISMLPAAFTNKHTSAVLQGVRNFGRPGSILRPTFTSTSNYSSPSSDGGSSSGSWNDGLAGRQQITHSSRYTSSYQRLVAPEEDILMNRTGTLAAQVRLEGNHQRHRLPSEIAAPTKLGKENREKNGLFSDRILRHIGYKRAPAKDSQVQVHVQVQSVSSILKTIWPNIAWPVRLLMMTGFFAAAVGAAATPVFSFILSRLIQTYALGSKGQHQAMIYSVSTVGIAVITATCAYVQHVCLEYAGQRWVNRIRERALERVLDQPLDFFTHEENSVSRIVEGLDRHAEEMRNLLGRFAAIVLTAVVMVLVSLIWALINQWKLTLVALSVGPYIYAVTKAFATVSGRWEARSNTASEATSAIFFETFTSIRTVRALTLEEHFSKKYFEATRVALIIGMKRVLWSGFFYGLSEVSGEFVMALIFYCGAVFVRDGASVKKIVGVFIQLIITINQVSSLLGSIPQMTAAREMASRILRLAHLPKDSHEHSGNVRPNSIGDIVFTDLSFSYPARSDQVVLRNVSLLIPAGQCTAIVGSSGSGKSTIAALLLRLYTTAPDHAILHPIPDLVVSGRDIKHIHTPILRSLITVVAQSPALFSATIAENIVYGLSQDSPHNNHNSIREAAAHAGIDDFIMTLPDGYATLVGDGGIGLSGGQSQRIAIARALIRKPAVLILDEATSALDAESARLIRHTIHALVEQQKKSMIVIIITHSKDMMAIADNIVVLDHGNVVEQGHYDELLAEHSEFGNLLSGGEWETDPRGKTDRENSVIVKGMTGNVDWGGT